MVVVTGPCLFSFLWLIGKTNDFLSKRKSCFCHVKVAMWEFASFLQLQTVDIFF